MMTTKKRTVMTIAKMLIFDVGAGEALTTLLFLKDFNLSTLTRFFMACSAISLINCKYPNC
ncbi:hypothetical protein HanIR_Chr16g0832751 [Helianthus annuus]|nr:hypothetical protein HanIR_Chr16g0832751 [Helianthus annuus]